MAQSGLETVFDVPPRLRQPLAEVLVPLRFDPRVMLRPVLQPFFVDLGREQLRKRGADRVLPSRAAREVNIRVDRETYAGQNISRTACPRASERKRHLAAATLRCLLRLRACRRGR